MSAKWDACTQLPEEKTGVLAGPAVFLGLQMKTLSFAGSNAAVANKDFQWKKDTEKRVKDHGSTRQSRQGSAYLTIGFPWYRI